MGVLKDDDDSVIHTLHHDSTVALNGQQQMVQTIEINTNSTRNATLKKELMEGNYPPLNSFNPSNPTGAQRLP